IQRNEETASLVTFQSRASELGRHFASSRAQRAAPLGRADQRCPHPQQQQAFRQTNNRRVMLYVPAERGCRVPGGPCHPWLVSVEADRPLLHPLLAGRWSPTTFDASHQLAAAEIEALLEAARWAPSAGNSQPWAF